MELGLASSAPTATPRVQAARVLRSAARSLEHVITAGQAFLEGCCVAPEHMWRTQAPPSRTSRLPLAEQPHGVLLSRADQDCPGSFHLCRRPQGQRRRRLREHGRMGQGI